MVSRILVPVDGSPHSQRALAFAANQWPGAEVTLLHVINPVQAGYSPGTGIPSGAEEWYESAKASAHTLLDDAAETVASLAPDATVHTRTDVGRPASTIIDAADPDAFDIVVMGSHGRTGVSRILLGSVAETVVRKAPIPVTVVR